MKRILVAGIGNVFLGDDGFGVAVVQDADVPGADELSSALEKKRAASGGERLAFAVEIRACNLVGAADTNFVGAVCAATTFTPVDEQVIKLSMMREARRLNGRIPREVIQRRVGSDAQSGLRIKFRQKNPLPIRAESQP